MVQGFRSNLDEYVDGIDLDNLQKLMDGRIETRSWWKDENEKPHPIIWRADMKIDHGIQRPFVSLTATTAMKNW